MKKKVACLLFAALVAMVNLKAQVIVLSESFENGIPAGWTQENIVGNQAWVTETDKPKGALSYPDGVVSGFGRAVLRNTSGETNGYKTRLITPVMNLDTIFQPILRYYHAQMKWTADFDTLRVFYRTTKNGEWKLLQEFNKPIQAWTKEQIELPQPSVAYQLCFEGSENLGRGIVLDSVVVRSKPECTTPYDMSTVSMSERGVTLVWKANYDVDEFRVLLAKSDAVFDIDTVNIEEAKRSGLIVRDTVVSNENYLWQVRFNNLDVKVNYVAFAQSLCEMENSDWGVLPFFMKAVRKVPYRENFNMAEAAGSLGRIDEWTYGNNTGKYNPFINRHQNSLDARFYVHEGTALCFTGGNNVGSGFDIPANRYVYAATPEIDTTNIKDCQVRFWGSLGAYGSFRTHARAIIIGVMEDPDDFSSFVPVDTMTLWRYATYEEHITSLASYTGEGKYVAFVSDFDKPNQFYIDDLVIEPVPAVAKVTGVKALPGSTEAEISWKNTAASYSLVVATTNTEKVDTLNKAEKVIETNVSAAKYTAKKLETSTKYYVYVKAQGGEWSNAVEFTTSWPFKLPMSWGFEEEENQNYVEFNRNNNKQYTYVKSIRSFATDPEKPYVYTGNNSRNGSKCALYLSMDVGRDAWITFPQVDTVIQGVEIEFYARGNAYSQLIAGVMIDPEDLTTFEPVAEFSVTSNSYQRCYANFVDYTGEGKYIAIRWFEKADVSGKVSSSQPYIDDVTIQKLASCVTPVISAKDITSETATITWTAPNMTQFQIIVDSLSTRSENQLGTLTEADNGVYHITTVSDTNAYTLPAEKLRWGRRYYVYMRSVCDEDEYSYWSTAYPVTLGVPAEIKLPYTENFDYWGTGSGTMAAGWKKVSSTSYPYIYTSSKYLGYAGLYLNNGSGATSKCGNAVAPALAIDELSKVKLSFWGKAAKAQSASYPDSLYIGVANSMEDDAVVTWLDTVSIPTTTFTYFERVYPQWIPSMGRHFVFTSYHSTCKSGNTLYLDEITFEDMVNIKPFGFETVEANAEDATISWLGESNNGWNVIVTTDIIRPDTVNKVDAKLVVVKDSVVMSNPVKIEGLTPQTNYYIYLKPVAGDSTTWSEGYNFITQCQKLLPNKAVKYDFEGVIPVGSSNISTYKDSRFLDCWTCHGADENKASIAYVPYIYQYKKGTKITASSNVHDGLAAACIKSSTTYYPAWFATPEIDAKDMSNVTVTFWAKASSKSNKLYIGVMQNPDDWGTYTQLFEWAPGNTAWAQVERNLGDIGYQAGMGNYIVFATPNEKAASTYYIDDIEISESSCRNANPVLSKLTDKSVRLAYGSDPMDVRMIFVKDSVLSADQLNAEDNSAYLAQVKAYPTLLCDSIVKNRMGIVLSDLNPSTPYCVALQSQCGEQMGKWVVRTFSTLCVLQTAGEMGVITFEQGYNDTTATSLSSDYRPVPCWTTGSKKAIAQTYIPYVGKGMGAPAGEKFLWFHTDAIDEGGYAIMPAIDIDTISRLQVSFLGRAMDKSNFGTVTPAAVTTQAGSIIVGIVTDPSDLATFVAMDTIKYEDNDIHRAVVRFNEYAGDHDEDYGKHIAFLSEFGKKNYFMIDNISVDTIAEGCGEPLALRVNQITGSSAVITWKGISPKYRVMVTTEEIAQKNWETNTNYVINEVVDTCMFVATGLKGITKHYVYVKALCDNNDGLWCLDPVTFYTDCPEVISLPYVEDFDRYTSSSTKNPPACWSTFYAGNVNDAANYPSVYSIAKYGTLGNGLSWSTNATNAADSLRATATTLPIEGDISTMTISFKLRHSSTSAVSKPSAILLGLASNVSCLDSLLATVQYVDTIYPPTTGGTWLEYSRIMDDCKGENMHVVMAEYYVTTTGYTLYMDDFKVEKTPTCYTPEFAITDITTDKVQLLIAPYFPTDKAWDARAISADEQDTLFVASTDTVCAITGLKHSSLYTLQVRTNCGEGDVSLWSEPVTFFTRYKIGDGMSYGFEPSEGITRTPYSTSDTYVAHPSLFIGSNMGATSAYNAPYQLQSAVGAKVSRAGDYAIKLPTTATYCQSWFALPEILGADTLQLRFDWRAAKVNAGDTILETNTYPFAHLEIGVVNADYDIDSYQKIAEYAPSVYRLREKVTEKKNRLFDHVVVPVPSDLGDKHIVFMNRTVGSSEFYVDNLQIEKKQGYQTPVIGTSTITPTTLTLNWEANGATEWNVYLVDSIKFFPFDSIRGDAVVVKQNVKTNTVTFTGLTPNKEYFAYLQVADAKGLGATSARRAYRMPFDVKIASDSVISFEGKHTKTMDENLVGLYPVSATAGDSLYAMSTGWYVGNDITTARAQMPWARLNNYTVTSTSKSDGIKVAYKGERALQLYSTVNSTALGAYAVMPLVDVDFDTIQVNFYARPYSETAKGAVGIAGSIYKGLPLVVGTMTDPNCPETFVAIDSLFYENTTLTTSTVAATLDNSGFQKFAFRLKGAKGQYVAFSAPLKGQWYIDDISFGERTCLSPTKLTSGEITAHSAKISWEPQDEDVPCILQVSNVSSFIKDSIVFESYVQGTDTVVAGLRGATNYYYRVRQACGAENLSAWTTIKEFYTECPTVDASYSTHFEYEDGQTPILGNTSWLQPKCWTGGTTGSQTSVSNFPDLTKSNGTSWYSRNTAETKLPDGGYKHVWALELYSSANTSTGSGYDQWAATPELSDVDMDTLQMVFYGLPASYNPLTGFINTSYVKPNYLSSIIVGVMTDPTDLSTFTPLDTCTYTLDSLVAGTTVATEANEFMFQRYIISLKEAKGKGNYIAFRTYLKEWIDQNPGQQIYTDTYIYTRMYIDDVSFEHLNECAVPTNLTATDITLHSAKLSWSGDEGAQWVVNVSADPSFRDEAAAILTNETVSEMNVIVNGLDTFQTYYWKVQQLCDALTASPVSQVSSFHTLRVPMFDEKFIMNLTVPTDWMLDSTRATAVFAGAPVIGKTASYMWSRDANANHMGMTGPHIKAPLSSANSATPSATAITFQKKSWLITPAIVLDDTKDAWLTFTAALTYHNADSEPMLNGWDDQFMVVVSDDEGKTWKRENAVIWNNETTDDKTDEHYVYGKGDYVLNDIPSHTSVDEPVFIELSKYKGKTIKVGFYHESMVINAYNSIRIGNVHINYVVTQEEKLSACQFEDMQSSDGTFNVDGDHVKVGTTIFEKARLASLDDLKQDANAVLLDTLRRLIADYKEAPQFIINKTICEGEETGAEWGFVNRSKTGTYKRKATSFVTGCDSITVLNLTVTPRIYTTIMDTICAGTSYTFNGKSYSETGVYEDTLTSVVTGCDSIAKLVLLVNAPITKEIEGRICTGMSYNFTPRYPALTYSGKYIDTLKTIEGCDSVVTLNLTVADSIGIMLYDTICAGETYQFEGQEYSETGTYVARFSSAAGCDSIRTLFLTVGKLYSDTIVAGICEGRKYTGHGFVDIAEPGLYSVKNQSIFGCDSVTWLQLSLTDVDTVKVDTTITVEDLPYFYENTSITYPRGTEPNTYVDTITVTGGGEQCDYVLIHTLVVRGGEGVDNVRFADLLIRPNVVRRGEVVYIDNDFTSSERAEMRIEMFDMVGHRMDIQVPEAGAIMISDFPTAGVYTVRISTFEQTYIGRIIVKN